MKRCTWPRTGGQGAIRAARARREPVRADRVHDDVDLLSGGGPAADRETLPIGRPIPHAQVYLLDRHGNPVPIGVPGELHIGGPGLARGYLNRPDADGRASSSRTPSASGRAPACTGPATWPAIGPTATSSSWAASTAR